MPLDGLEEVDTGGLTRDLVESVRDGLKGSLSAATHRAYQGDWGACREWCGQRGVGFLPAHPATVAGYLRHLEGQGGRSPPSPGHSPRSSQGHKAAGHDSPRSSVVVRKIIQAIRRRFWYPTEL